MQRSAGCGQRSQRLGCTGKITPLVAAESPRRACTRHEVFLPLVAALAKRLQALAQTSNEGTRTAQERSFGAGAKASWGSSCGLAQVRLLQLLEQRGLEPWPQEWRELPHPAVGRWAVLLRSAS